MNTPGISIILPVYNVEKYLRKSIESVLNQTYKALELIIIDDGSTDMSSQICDEFAAYDNRIIVIHQINMGLPSARESGYTRARAEYLLFIDSDDWIESDMVELMINKAESTGADLVICDYWNEYRDYHKIVTAQLPEKKGDIICLFSKRPDYMNYFWNKLIRRRLFVDHRVDFPKNISLCEDLYVTFKLCFYAKKIVGINKPLYHYSRINVMAITKNHTMQSIKSKLSVIENLIIFLKQNNELDRYMHLVNFYKIYGKILLIIEKDIRNHHLWKTIYPEAHAYIFKTDLRFDYKIMSWLASIGLYRIAYIMQDMKRVAMLCKSILSRSNSDLSM